MPRRPKKRSKALLAAPVVLLAIAYLIYFVIVKLNPSNPVFSEGDEGALTEDTETGDAPDVLIFDGAPVSENIERYNTLELLLTYLYMSDDDVPLSLDDFDLPKLMDIDLSLDLENTKTSEPLVLITHTHAYEAFADSRPGNSEDTIVGIGDYLTHVLATEYGIPVIHDLGRYDIDENNVVTTDNAYQRMEEGVSKILETYPTIEVILDLHRDAVPDGVKLVTEINDLQTAKIMFVNGLTKLFQNGETILNPLDLYNPYLPENMAFSLKMQLTANELYEGFTRRIYLKAYRYSLHMRPRSLLIEVGANTNTFEEAKNAVKPLAEILVRVLNPGGNR